MNHRSGIDRSQTLLFPESLDDYVTTENPVRFLNAFVAHLMTGWSLITLAYNLKRVLNLVTFEKLMAAVA